MVHRWRASTRTGKIAIAIAVTAVAGSAAGLAVAAQDWNTIPGTNITVPTEKAKALQRLNSASTRDANTTPTPLPPVHFDPIPAHVLGPDVPVPIPPSTLNANNGWLVSDGKSLVAVYAGSAGPDASEGRVVIVRQNLIAGKQTVHVVDAGKTGALTIEKAPQGDSVETSAQVADIGLKASTGRAVTLHLNNDTIGG